MITLSEAVEIARKELGSRAIFRAQETKKYWIFYYDWDAMKFDKPVPGLSEVIIDKETGKSEYPPIPPRMPPQMREEFRNATPVQLPDSKA